MKFKTNPIAVRYCETDQMGFVHHSNYLKFFELARISWLEKLGLSYAAMEKSGILMPVVKVQLHFKTPLYFGENFQVHVQLLEPPKATLKFKYEIFNDQGVLNCLGETLLAFLSKTSGRPMRCPEELRSVFAQLD
ncbi:acyl-CoA thioesterase [Flavobacteriaceae bacterium]|nr:acyl-CoA thioesterase [Flavobacteriaceae bacterium]